MLFLPSKEPRTLQACHCFKDISLGQKINQFPPPSTIHPNYHINPSPSFLPILNNPLIIYHHQPSSLSFLPILKHLFLTILNHPLYHSYPLLTISSAVSPILNHHLILNLSHPSSTIPATIFNHHKFSYQSLYCGFVKFTGPKIFSISI